MSNVSKRRREGSRTKIKSMGDHQEFLKRITKTLYYGQLPTLPCLSLPVTEVSCSLWSVSQRGRSLRRLHVDAAAGIARQACVSPCALVLAILYLERLNACNPDYLAATAPADLFLVSLMVGNKFLQDDGEDEEVICSEWAASGGLELAQLKKLEVEFLNAIEWNVFVSDESFESGLQWLEREVALRQGRARGFFTYGELAAGDAALRAAAAELLRAALLLAGALAACLASLLLAQASLPPRRAPPLARPLPFSNATLEAAPVDVLLGMDSLPGPKCCSKWARYQQETMVTTRNWYDGVPSADDETTQPWWSRSLLEWLYQSSLVTPMRRWLHKLPDVAALLRRDLVPVSPALPRCDEYVQHAQQHAPQHCARQWLNLSKLSVLLSSVSDR